MVSPIDIPIGLQNNLQQSEAGLRWLEDLPATVASLGQKWNLHLSAPYTEAVTGSWVAPCECPSGPAVLKVGFPHHEAKYEIDGLIAWAGRWSVRLLQFDRPLHALLLERCEPGTSLRAQPPGTQDKVITELSQALWLAPPPEQIQSLSSMIERWCDAAAMRYENLGKSADDIDFDLAQRGLTELRRLSRDSVEPKLLATDLHAGNVLASTRKPWLVIDPKPHVGDPSYDLTQHLMNIKPRIETEGIGLIENLANLAGVDAQRLGKWLFGRRCINPKDLHLARTLEPLV